MFIITAAVPAGAVFTSAHTLTTWPGLQATDKQIRTTARHSRAGTNFAEQIECFTTMAEAEGCVRTCCGCVQDTLGQKQCEVT